jgi:hypothetical protein
MSCSLEPIYLLPRSFWQSRRNSLDYWLTRRGYQVLDDIRCMSDLLEDTADKTVVQLHISPSFFYKHGTCQFSLMIGQALRLKFMKDDGVS